MRILWSNLRKLEIWTAQSVLQVGGEAIRIQKYFEFLIRSKMLLMFFCVLFSDWSDIRVGDGLGAAIPKSNAQNYRGKASKNVFR